MTAPQVTTADPGTGVVEALVAVTGVRDDVGDIIVPGAFKRTLVERKPKGVLGHDWNRPVAKTLAVHELLPGDPRLPRKTGDGKPWPREAGALWVRAQYNLASKDGRDAYEAAKFYGPAEQGFSIGYKAAKATHRGGTRYIEELDLFEYSPVLHGANKHARLLALKDGRPMQMETKTAALRPGRRSAGLTTFSWADLAEAEELKAAIALEELDEADVAWTLDGNGDLKPAACAVCGGRVPKDGGTRIGSTFYCPQHALGGGAA